MKYGVAMRILEAYFHEDGPGAVAIVSRSGEIVFAECIGLSNIETGTPLGLDSIFDIASVSKSYTAALVLRALDRGLISLDQPAGHYLECLQVDGTRPITIKDLLWHTSGLPDYLDPIHELDIQSLQQRDVLAFARIHVKSATPGCAHSYSNTNYVALAAILESCYHRSFSQCVELEICARLGLHDTFTLGRDLPEGRRVTGYFNDGYGKPRFVTAMSDIPILGDGGVLCTPIDLLRWVHAIVDGSATGAQMRSTMFQRGSLDDGTTFDYGAGLIVEIDLESNMWIGHTGGWFGASAYVGHDCKSNTSTVIVSNEQLAPLTRIAQHLGLLLDQGPGHRPKL